jgi:osomolarity two-component system response regulator SKN7
MHLKVIQQMSKFPRTVDMPSINAESLADALAPPTNGTGSGPGSSVQLMALAGSAMVPNGTLMGVDDDGRINPLAGLGLTDDQYAMILQSMVNGESFPGMPRMTIGVVGDSVSGPSVGEKRGLEDGDDPTDVKRSRFELVE